MTINNLLKPLLSNHFRLNAFDYLYLCIHGFSIVLRPITFSAWFEEDFFWRAYLIHCKWKKKPIFNGNGRGAWHPLFLEIIDKDYTKRCKSCKSKWNVSSRECKWNVNVAKMSVITFHLALYSFYHAHLSILPLNSTFQFSKKRLPSSKRGYMKAFLMFFHFAIRIKISQNLCNVEWKTAIILLYESFE